MWVFCTQAKITAITFFLLLSVKACHSYLEKHSWEQEMGGREQGQEETKERGKRKGVWREGGRKFKQTINEVKCVKCKEWNSEGVAITVIPQLHPEHGGAWLQGGFHLLGGSSLSTLPLVLKRTCENHGGAQAYIFLPWAATLCGMSELCWGHSLVQQ